MRTGARRSATLTMSWMTAPSPLVTTPITRGSRGRGRFRALSKSPSAASFFFRSSSASSAAPRPDKRADSAMNWRRPRATYTVTRPTITMRAPSTKSLRERAGAVRYITQSMVASFVLVLEGEVRVSAPHHLEAGDLALDLDLVGGPLDHAFEAPIELGDAEDQARLFAGHLTGSRTRRGLEVTRARGSGSRAASERGSLERRGSADRGSSLSEASRAV